MWQDGNEVLMQHAGIPQMEVFERVVLTSYRLGTDIEALGRQECEAALLVEAVK